MGNFLKHLKPIHWIICIYALISGLIALFYSTSDQFLTVHSFPRIIILIWILTWVLAQNAFSSRTWNFINMTIPLVSIGFFYSETQYINQFLLSYQDPVLAKIDLWLFGFQPSISLSSKFNSLFFIELMFMAYFSYYLITFGFCLYLLMKKHRLFDKLVFIIISSYILHFMFFIVFPTAGPQYFLLNELPEFSNGGMFFWAVRTVQSFGEGPTAAFPSSHVALTLVVLWLAFKYARPALAVLLPLSVLLCISVVYIQAHYAVDVIIAFISAPMVFSISDFIWLKIESKTDISKKNDNHKVTLHEITNWYDLYQFINLPFKLHKDHKSWTPPLLMDEWKQFDLNKNPAFEHCSSLRLLAVKNGEPVGRVIGLIRHDYNELHNEKNARFAFIEVPEDLEVLRSLLYRIETWAMEKGCEGLIGPFGFSDKDPQGLVIEGFDSPSLMFTNCNYSYLPSMLEKLGFNQFLRLVQYKFPLNQKVIEQMAPFSQRAIRNGQLKMIEFGHTKDIKPYVNEVFELINKTYTDIYGFSEVTKKEAKDFADRFLQLLNPRLIKIVTDLNGSIAAFIVAMPNLAPALKKAQGKLLPTGWYHLMKENKNSRELVLLLGAIRPDMRNRGIDAILGVYLFKSAFDLGFKIIDSHLILENNHKMRAEYERINGSVLYKKYGIYHKPLKSLI